LRGQVASESAFRRFARDMSAFSTTVAGSDKDLRRLIDNGSASANELRTFLEANEVDLGELINNVVTTGELVVTHLDGVEQLLVLYPYVVEGGFTVVSKSPGSGLYDAHFGMVMTDTPHPCRAGYESTDQRSPLDGSNKPMNEAARCTSPPTETNARGSQNAPRPRAATGWSSPDVAVDPASGAVVWGSDAVARLLDPGRPAPRTLGNDTWKWLLLQPLAG
ncbi:MAG: MCE family protein, partial [Nocardioides sp.]|nr:MCE family protein [Nocardioides sp.]